MKKSLVLIVLLCLLLCLAACGGEETVEPEATEEPEVVSITSPLDGTVIDEMPTRLFAVAIDNGRNSEPQSGLAEAEVVFELPVEGGITRFLALFYHATPEKIGPVRSARHYVIPLAQGLNAVYIHCGQSIFAQSYFEENDVEHINEISHTSGFWRDSSRSAPVNLYTSWENLVEETTSLGWYEPVSVPAFTFFTEEEQSALVVGEVTEIHIPYTYKAVDYLWDGEKYLRQSNGKPHADAETGETLSAVNIIVQYVETTVISNEGHLDIDYYAGGKGLIFNNGQVREIQWLQEDATSPMTYTYADTGKAVQLMPGKTFINLVPKTLTVTYPVTESDEV